MSKGKGKGPTKDEAYIGAPDIRDPDAFAARMHGDSMTPKYQEGDIIIFSPAIACHDGADCYVRFADGSTTFKRCFREDGGMIRLQPRNEKYRPQIVREDEIEAMSPAIYRYERVDGDDD
jgi:phage repressor protein C with HTH and peptisase S24 domain